jgi:retinol binding receptor-like protein
MYITAGFAVAAVRLVVSLLLSLLLFIRLDISIFPGSLSMYDPGHHAYMAMLWNDHTNNSPVYAVATAMLAESLEAIQALPSTHCVSVLRPWRVTASSNASWFGSGSESVCGRGTPLLRTEPGAMDEGSLRARNRHSGRCVYTFNLHSGCCCLYV